jgi:hypothetical protein
MYYLRLSHTALGNENTNQGKDFLLGPTARYTSTARYTPNKHNFLLATSKKQKHSPLQSLFKFQKAESCSHMQPISKALIILLFQFGSDINMELLILDFNMNMVHLFQIV